MYETSTSLSIYCDCPAHKDINPFTGVSRNYTHSGESKEEILERLKMNGWYIGETQTICPRCNGR
jgi:hypothetical protein